MKDNLDQARLARGLLAKVRVSLCRPTVEALDKGAADLSLVIRSLQQLQTSLTGSGHRGPLRDVLEAEMISVRSELRGVHALLAGAGSFHAGWTSLSAADEGPSNYTVAGTAARTKPMGPGRVVMHG